MINFSKEDGGHIDFQFDTVKYYGVSQRGTSVPLWEEELIFAPKRKCSCANPACTAQETHFCEEEVRKLEVLPDVAASSIQEYGKYSCWVLVELFDQDKVDAACPAGMVPAIATKSVENGVYHVQRFLWT